MPPRKTYRKKKVYRKRRNNAKRVPRNYISSKPKICSFTREQWFTLNLTNATPALMGIPTYWNAELLGPGNRVNFQPAVALDNITNYSEISNLFGQYRINGLGLTFYPTHTTSSATAAPLYNPPSLIMFSKQNQTGAIETSFTEAVWAEIIRKKTRIFCASEKPTSMFCRTSIQNVAAEQVIPPAAPTLKIYPRSPRWISTLLPDVQHTCLTVSLATMDNSTLSSWAGAPARMAFKVRMKVYFQARFVK